MQKKLLALLFLACFQHSHAQWTTIPSPYGGNFWSIKFFDQNIGYMGGNTVIMKTVNGGDTWTSTPVSNFLLNCFSFPSATVGYYAASNNVIAKTTNQGVSWTNQNPNASPYTLSSVSFPAVDTGYAVGDAGVIRKTINGGTTWTTQSSGLTTDLNEVHFFSTTVGICVGDSGKIKRTTNGGATWTTIASGTTVNLYDIHFIDANVGFIAGGVGTVLKTLNGGVSWTSVPTGSTQWLYAICFKNALEGCAGGASGTMLKTSNGGVTWQLQTTGMSVQAINDIIYINNRFIAVADQGKIITDAPTLSVSRTEKEAPAIIIAPNPTADYFSIAWQGVTALSATVSVYNALGAVVKTASLSANNQQVDVSELSDGIYTVEVRSADFTSTNKLVVRR